MYSRISTWSQGYILEHLESLAIIEKDIDRLLGVSRAYVARMAGYVEYGLWAPLEQAAVMASVCEVLYGAVDHLTALKVLPGMTGSQQVAGLLQVLIWKLKFVEALGHPAHAQTSVLWRSLGLAC